MTIQTSDSLGKFAPAFLEFQRDVKDPQKNSTNPHFRNKYASLEDSIEAIRPVANRHGLTISQWRTGHGLTTLILHESGEYIMGEASMVLDKQTPQGLGSATTYERRYSLLGATGTSGDVDDDGEGAMEAHRGPVEATKPKEAPSVQQSTKGESRGLLDGFSKRIGDAMNLEELKQAWVQIANSPLTHEQKEMLAAVKDKKKEQLGA